MIKNFYVNGNKEVPGILFGTNTETSLDMLSFNLEEKLNQLKNEGYKIISIVPAHSVSGGGSSGMSVYIDCYQVLIVAEKD